MCVGQLVTAIPVRLQNGKENTNVTTSPSLTASSARPVNNGNSNKNYRNDSLSPPPPPLPTSAIPTEPSCDRHDFVNTISMSISKPPPPQQNGFVRSCHLNRLNHVTNGAKAEPPTTTIINNRSPTHQAYENETNRLNNYFNHLNNSKNNYNQRTTSSHQNELNNNNKICNNNQSNHLDNNNKHLIENGYKKNGQLLDDQHVNGGGGRRESVSKILSNGNGLMMSNGSSNLISHSLTNKNSVINGNGIALNNVNAADDDNVNENDNVDDDDDEAIENSDENCDNEGDSDETIEMVDVLNGEYNFDLIFCTLFFF